MRGQLPATIINGGGDSFGTWARFPTLKGSWPWLGSDHTAYHRASLINLYLHAKCNWNRRNFVDGQTYVSTYVWMDGHLRPALLGRLCWRVDLKILF